MIELGVKPRLWLDADQVCDSFTVPLTVPEKLYSDVPVFTPANHRYLNCQGDWFVGNGNLQCQITSCTQCDVATYLAAGGREVE